MGKKNKEEKDLEEEPKEVKSSGGCMGIDVDL